jgi:hypothetical protein
MMTTQFTSGMLPKGNRAEVLEVRGVVLAIVASTRVLGKHEYVVRSDTDRSHGGEAIPLSGARAR